MTQLNTDLTDLSDVTDEAIEAALRAIGDGDSAAMARSAIKARLYWPKPAILLARCIQAHYPDMIVDPVTLKAREIVSASGFISDGDESPSMAIAKAAILAGMAMERGE